ncbi:MAG: hypothetical protein EVA78_01840 [Phycisphaeraceae bacterium]|jgi:hypothetical protein|nr:MAG: hypothetical protein EVA78_01840 [Phycisphaeraceae bacterium]|tara:strand:- start:264 stop:776 length:513 start_codon:yes stop_codon:yes gene_type:complete
MVSSVVSSHDMTFGFLTVCDAANIGMFGGYLLVDITGRPLEFHCTAPLRVTRAQEILYGATLQRHLHGEQIGGPLLKATQLSPVAVLTDRESLLHARSYGASPVVVIQETDSQGDREESLCLGAFQLRPHEEDMSKIDQLRPHFETLSSSIELAEPFGRIRAAIDEAQHH